MQDRFWLCFGFGRRGLLTKSSWVGRASVLNFGYIDGYDRGVILGFF